MEDRKVSDLFNIWLYILQMKRVDTDNYYFYV